MQGTWIQVWEMSLMLFIGNVDFGYRSDFERLSKEKHFFLFGGICKLNALSSLEGPEQLSTHSGHISTFGPGPVLSCNTTSPRRIIFPTPPQYCGWTGPCGSFRPESGEQKRCVPFWARTFGCQDPPELSSYHNNVTMVSLVTFKMAAAPSALVPEWPYYQQSLLASPQWIFSTSKK